MEEDAEVVPVSEAVAELVAEGELVVAGEPTRLEGLDVPPTISRAEIGG